MGSKGRGVFACLSIMLAGTACGPPEGVDIDGPRVLFADLVPPRRVEVGVRESMVIELSEPLDPASVHRGSVALVEWEEVGRCDLDPSCEEGSCERGRCQVSPLTTTLRGKVDRGEFEADVDLDFELGQTWRGPATRLTVTPSRALRPHARHSLVLGAAITDRAGNPVGHGGRVERGAGGPGAPAILGWQSDFVTGSRGSSGPEATLVWPLPGLRDAPTNLATVLLSYSTPVQVDESTIAFIEDEAFSRITLLRPSPCEGWVEGRCLAWEVAEALDPQRKYRPVPGGVVDLRGRAEVAPFELSWFRTGPDRDVTPPSPEVGVERRGHCLVAHVTVDEAVELSFSIGHEGGEHGELATSSTLPGKGSMELGLVLESAAGEAHSWQVAVVDLVGNEVVLEGQHVDSHEASAPVFAVTEVLANPSGPEPAQEFVELLALGDATELSIGSLRVADLAWPEIEAKLALGEIPGDAIPDFTLFSGQLAIIVGSGYDAAQGDDPSPDPTAVLLTLDDSLVQSGLKNAGEPVTLFWPEPPTLAGSYGNYIDTSGGHAGRSVAAVDPLGCDVSANWRSSPSGRSTPGRWP